MGKNNGSDRRQFIKHTAAAATGLALFSSFSKKTIDELSNAGTLDQPLTPAMNFQEPRIKFSVININHSHIYGMVDAVTRGGGQLVSFYAKEPDLVAAFQKKVSPGKTRKR